MLRKISTIVACSALVVFATAAAQARESNVNVRFAGVSVNQTPSFSQVDFQLKGAEGPAIGRGVQLYGPAGPPSANCAGFDFEVPIVGGSGASTYNDFSQLYTVITSGYSCVSFGGANKTATESVVVGGSGRFAGASGSLRSESEGVVSNQGFFPNTTAFTGSITGTVTLP